MHKTPCIYRDETTDPNQEGVDRIAVKLDAKNGVPYIWAIYKNVTRSIRSDDVTLVMTLVQACLIFDVMSAEEYALAKNRAEGKPSF